MKKISTLLTTSALILAGMFSNTASAQIVEDFNDITTLTASGWNMQNLSAPVGTTGWFQGNATVFPAFNGATDDYIGANYNNTGNTGTISNWLIAPTVTLRNGDVFTFYSRQAVTTYADRMQVCLSTNGSSTNVGATATSVGDFTTLLLDINPTLTATGYPEVWTLYTITISGLPAPTSGRLAFRYFVTNAGFSGTNSDYIGIDAFTYTPYVCPTVTVTGTTPNGTAGVAYSQSLSQTGALGTPSFSVTAGALPPGVTLSSSGTISGTPTATGTFNFTVTVSDASGCSGSQPYSITIVCPTGGATMSAIPAQCDNGTPYTLVEGTPAGGTYSGTNVSGGMFDPSGGTQTITYTVIDAYGCTQVTSGTATVNTAPTVSIAPFTAVCDNGGMVTLTGESPTGGTWSGTNVSGNMFDPSAGTQTIMYMYTDGNGCSNMATQSFPVNAAPTVTLTPFPSACDNDGMLNLIGESPTGGTWSGTGVTGNQFDPTVGTQTVTYTYTDGNGCSNSASASITVNAATTVTLSSFTPVCDNGGMVTLTGESPAGGTWSGTNVSGNTFDPSAGTQTITYTYQDSNGCTNTASQPFNVNAAPAVSVTPFAPVCDNSGMVALTGESPVGGTWSGTGVTGNQFDPSAGTQTVTYTYTDSITGCTNTDDEIITVNTAPTVTGSAAFTTVCLDDASVALTGSPAGGTWSGTGVTGSSFSPMAAGTGPETLTYLFTDANGCDGTATVVITVNACVGIAESTFSTDIVIYPNPTTGVFTMTFAQDGPFVVNIMSVDGKVIASEQRTNGNAPQSFDLSGYPKGVYLLEVQNATGRSFSKIVLQ
jgi:hypothetical protein